MAVLPRAQAAIFFATLTCLSACTTGPKPLPPPVYDLKTAGNPSESQIKVTHMTVTSKVPGAAGRCELGATLLQPSTKAKGLVIFVHGSGPIDREGNLPGGYHIYRDLALGLAKGGYASFRFDKRSAIPDCAKKIGPDFSPYFFIEDLKKITAAARALPPLDETPVIFLGHSQGVTLLLEAINSDELTGDAVILMAGLGRYPIDATVLRQLRQASEKPGIAPNDKAKLLDSLSKGTNFFLKIRENEAMPNDFYMGAYSRFWTELVAMTDRTSEAASHLDIPALILQGEGDTNVSADDFKALKQVIDTPLSQSNLFPNLDHLFVAPGQKAVDPKVTSVMTAWLDSLFVQKNNH